jgi:hypothetical protein
LSSPAQTVVPEVELDLQRGRPDDATLTTKLKKLVVAPAQPDPCNQAQYRALSRIHAEEFNHE